MVPRGAASQEVLEGWQDRLAIYEAELASDEAQLRKAELQYESNIDGVNTSVAEIVEAVRRGWANNLAG